MKIPLGSVFLEQLLKTGSAMRSEEAVQGFAQPNITCSSA